MFIFGVTVVLYFVKILSGSRNFYTKINSSHLREISKNVYKIVYYKIYKNIKYKKCITKFLYLFYFGRYSDLNQRTVRHLGLIFNHINYVLVTSQKG